MFWVIISTTQNSVLCLFWFIIIKSQQPHAKWISWIISATNIELQFCSMWEVSWNQHQLGTEISSFTILEKIKRRCRAWLTLNKCDWWWLINLHFYTKILQNINYIDSYKILISRQYESSVWESNSAAWFFIWQSTCWKIFQYYKYSRLQKKK